MTQRGRAGVPECTVIDSVVASVTVEKPGYWKVELADKRSVRFDRDMFRAGVPSDLEPRVGDRIRVYGETIGELHAVELNGRLLFLTAPDELVLYALQVASGRPQGLPVDLELEGATLDEWLAGLPTVLSAGFRKIRDLPPGSRWDPSHAVELRHWVNAYRVAAAARTQTGRDYGEFDEPEARAAVEALTAAGALEAVEYEDWRVFPLVCELAAWVLIGHVPELGSGVAGTRRPAFPGGAPRPSSPTPLRHAGR
jgi:hypothetical protein